MNVLSARDADGNELTVAQIKEDWDKLQAANEKAKQEDPTWYMFGGMLYLNGREYQVR